MKGLLVQGIRLARVHKLTEQVDSALWDGAC